MQSWNTDHWDKGHGTLLKYWIQRDFLAASSQTLGKNVTAALRLLSTVCSSMYACVNVCVWGWNDGLSFVVWGKRILVSETIPDHSKADGLNWVTRSQSRADQTQAVGGDWIPPLWEEEGDKPLSNWPVISYHCVFVCACWDRFRGPLVESDWLIWLRGSDGDESGIGNGADGVKWFTLYLYVNSPSLQR